MGLRPMMPANGTNRSRMTPNPEVNPQGGLLTILKLSPVGGNRNVECVSLYDRRSAAACCLLAARDSSERPRVGCDGGRNSLAIDELPFAAAGDQPGLVQDFEMVRDSCSAHAAH